MSDGFYLEKKQKFIKTIMHSLRSVPMVLAKLWLPILLAVLCDGLSYLVVYVLKKYGIGVYVPLLFSVAFVMAQVYLWAAVLVGADHLLSKFSAFRVSSCYTHVNSCVIRLFLFFVLYLVWVAYTPHIFVAFFHWILSLFGVEGQWLIGVSFILGTLIVFSGIVTFIFIAPLILLKNITFRRAILESSELASPNWTHVAGVFAACFIAGLFVSPGAVWLNTLLGHVGAIVASLVISFVLYPLYIIFILHVMRFATLQNEKEPEKESDNASKKELGNMSGKESGHKSQPDNDPQKSSGNETEKKPKEK